MRNLVILLMIIAFVDISCKRETKPSQPESLEQTDKIILLPPESEGAKVDDGYSWTKKDRQKFISECLSNTDKEFVGNKLKEFCDCMLQQSQQYYSSYNQMEKASNEDSDLKIFGACGEFVEDEK